jgi:hypothetical protein
MAAKQFTRGFGNDISLWSIKFIMCHRASGIGGRLVFACQTTKTHFGRRSLCPQNCIGDHFTHLRTMFETMSSTSANDPDDLR